MLLRSIIILFTTGALALSAHVQVQAQDNSTVADENDKTKSEKLEEYKKALRGVLQQIRNDEPTDAQPETKKRNVVKPKEPTSASAQPTRRSAKSTPTKKLAPPPKKRTPSLTEAAHQGKLDLVKQWLSKGTDVETRHPSRGMTALMYAAEKGHYHVVDYLLQQGADINAKASSERQYGSVNGQNAFGFAFLNDHLDVAKHLLENKKFDIHAPCDHKGRIPLLMLTDHRDEQIKMIEYILNNGGDVAAGTPDGGKALLNAAENGHQKTVEYLIAAGADVNVQDEDQYTPLTQALRHHTSTHNYGKKMIQQLLAAEGQSSVDVAAGPLRRTPLMRAAVLNELDIVQLLIEAGANTELEDAKGHTAYSLARQRGRSSGSWGWSRSDRNKHAAIQDLLAGEPEVQEDARPKDERSVQVRSSNVGGLSGLLRAVNNGDVQQIEQIFEDDNNHPRGRRTTIYRVRTDCNRYNCDQEVQRIFDKFK